MQYFCFIQKSAVSMGSQALTTVNPRGKLILGKQGDLDKDMFILGFQSLKVGLME